MGELENASNTYNYTVVLQFGELGRLLGDYWATTGRPQIRPKATEIGALADLSLFSQYCKNPMWHSRVLRKI